MPASFFKDGPATKAHPGPRRPHAFWKGVRPRLRILDVDLREGRLVDVAGRRNHDRRTRSTLAPERRW